MKLLIQIESHGYHHAYHFRSPKIIGICKESLIKRQNWILLSGIKLEPGMFIYESGSALIYPRYHENEKRFEDFNEYKERVKNELEFSIAKIFENAGCRPKYLAWPFGEYNEAAIEIAKELKFEASFTTHIGSIKQNDNYYELKRFSPPRRRHLFLAAIKGNMGMTFYKSPINIVSFIKNFENCALRKLRIKL